MNLIQAKAVVEALIFAAPEPVTLGHLTDIVGLARHTVQQLVLELVEEYQRGQRGIQIIEVAGGYQMCTHPFCAPFVEKFQRNPRSTGLSQAALETLAIVAYKQPITRAEVESLRGVRVDSAINTLLEKDLVRESGRKDAPGRPILYATTREFLKYFGLKDLSELPGLDQWPSSEAGPAEGDDPAGPGENKPENDQTPGS